MKMKSLRGARVSPFLEKTSGFTLIELLVVIAIAAVLVALLFPAMRRSIESGRTAACVGNQKGIIAAVILYAGDNEGRLPDYADSSNLPSSMWWSRIGPYLSEEATEQRRAGGEFLRCPSADKTTVLTYGVNYGPYGLAPVTYGLPTDPATFPGSKRLSQVPKNTYIIADHADKSASSAIYNPAHYSLDSDFDKDGVLDSYSAFLPDYPYNHLGVRHNGSAVFGFVDGSVRVISGRDWAKAKDDGTGLWGN